MRRLRFAAWLTLATHLVAGLAMLFILRQGLETNTDLPARLRFISQQTAWWIGGWLTWNLAALSILYFYTAFAAAHELELPGRAAVLRLAVSLSTAGVALDLAAEAIEMGVLPGLAREALREAHSPSMDNSPDGSTESRLPPDSVAVRRFLTWHRAAVMLTGCMANGLYTLAAVLLSWTTRARYPAWVWLAGLAVGIAGGALSAAALLGSLRGMFWANVALGPCILLWQLGVALTAGKR